MNKITRMHILGHKVLEYDVDERGIIIDERERNRTNLDPKGGSYLVKEDSGDGIPSAIKKSMVLWYDIKKQGATNESLAANPVLTDLSGNGHDLTLHNFAFAGNSGIGIHKINWLILSNSNGVVPEKNGDTYLIPANTPYVGVQSNIPAHTETVTVPSIKVRVSGLIEDNKIYYYSYTNSTADNFFQMSNGEYDLPEITLAPTDRNTKLFLCARGLTNQDTPIKLEIIPDYQGSLCTDGVDDYGFVEGLPILEDFTIIAKRKYLNFPFDCVLANKIYTTNNDTRGISEPPPGAFAFELIESYGTRSSVPDEDVVINYSFGLYNVDLYQDIGDISYMTATSYNGKPVDKGDALDSDLLYIASSTGDYAFANVAIYSVLLFNRSLSEEEINWVKDNLINEETEQ